MQMFDTFKDESRIPVQVAVIALKYSNLRPDFGVEMSMKLE